MPRGSAVLSCGRCLVGEKQAEEGENGGCLVGGKQAEEGENGRCLDEGRQEKSEEAADAWTKRIRRNHI